jgi:hypothetical protein
MLNNITELKKLRADISVLQSREKELKKPVLDDLGLLPVLYGWFREIQADAPLLPDLDSARQRKKFIFVVIALYSPATFCGYATKAGLCNGLAGFFKLTPVSISRDISDMQFYYEHYRDYADSMDDIYEQIISRLNTFFGE